MTQQPETRRQRRDREAQEKSEIEEGVTTTMATQQAAGSTLAEMSPEQKEQAFAKWMDQQDNKKATNAAKRNAANILKGRYEDEYNKIFSDEKVRLAGGG